MRLVLDTSVLVTALRSPNGASGWLIDSVLHGRLRPLISVPLVLEYEAVLTRPDQLKASGFSDWEAVRIVKAFCKMGEPVHIAFRLRPQLPDPDDEFVLDTAFHGNAEAIVTFNCKDFPFLVKRFRFEAVLPKEAVRRMRSQ